MTKRLFMILFLALGCQTTAVVLAFGGTTMIRTTSIRPASSQRSLVVDTFGATSSRSLVVHHLGTPKTTTSSSLHLFHHSASAQGNRQKRMIPTWMHKCICWIRNSLLVWSLVLMCTAGSGYTTSTPLHVAGGAKRPLAAIMGRRSAVRNPNKSQQRFWSKSSSNNKIRRSTSTTTMNEGDLLTRKQSVFLVVAIATTGYLSAYYGRESNRSEESSDDDYYDFRKYHNKNRLWKEFSQERALNQTIPSMYHLFRSPSNDKENKNKPVDFDPLAVMWKKRNPQDRSVLRANKISQPEIILSQESQDFVQQLERQVADDAAAEATPWELQEFDPKLSIVVQSTTASSPTTTTTTHSNSSLVLSWTSTSFDHLSSSVSAFYEDPIEVVIEQKEKEDLAANATSINMDQEEVAKEKAVEENPVDLQARYAAIESLEDRAFQILHDLGMIDEHVQQSPEAEDEPNDDDPVPQNDHPDADLR